MNPHHLLRVLSEYNVQDFFQNHSDMIRRRTSRFFLHVMPSVCLVSSLP